MDPIPNILFQRDPIASIYNGMNIHNMTKATRKREGLFYVYLLKYHPEFKNTVKHHLNIDHEGHMEGGDVLVISKETIFVGVSERTTAEAVEALARTLFAKFSHLKQVIGLEIPSSHATMHLDTVMTQMDHDKFSIDLDMADEPCFVYEVMMKNGKLDIKTQKTLIINVLKKYVHKNTKLIKVAGGDVVAGKAEQ
jgi:arginine deiminase